MAEFPYMPLWTDAYLGDTRHLTTEEHGAYLLLLMEAWRRPSCSLPDSDQLLARLSGLTPAKWKRAKPIIMGFWKIDGRSREWVQKRLKKEREKTASKSRKSRDAAAARWKNSKNTHANAIPGGCHPDPYPDPDPEVKSPSQEKKVYRLGDARECGGA